MPTGGRVPGIHLVNPTRKVKNLGWFSVTWHCVNASMPIIGKGPRKLPPEEAL